jgi:hypothetical protein
MVRDDVHAESGGAVLQAGLEDARSGPLLVNPTRETMRELIETFEEVEVSAPVRLFADETPLKELTDDFLMASALADLIEAEQLYLRTLEAVPRNSLLVTEEFVVSLVDGGEQVAGLTTTDDDFVSRTYAHYESLWEAAEPFTLRTPPLSHIRETLADEIGEEAVADFDRVLDSLERARGDGDGLDEVTIALLVAANNGELLYDISRWGENIRLASKATFSRNKNRLEDSGIIDTEKVPIDVGRPRLRLMLANGDLQDADIEAVAERTQEALA